MDGRGRCLDNIFTERLWRTVKYENVYLKSYRTIEEARTGLAEYFQFYNTRRPHQSLNYQRPETVYFSRVESLPVIEQEILKKLSPVISSKSNFTV
ncbi:transposase [Candidatus Azambacteria bacterium]|nr:transposase [Candidatus Azambacteria bacterium]